MDIYELIRNGSFTTKMAYPTRIVMPPALNKKASDLTEEEVWQLREARAEHAAKVEQYKKDVDAYNREEVRLHKEFEIALAEECGISADHEFYKALYAVAWQQGHSGGLGDVVSAMMDLQELIGVAVKNGMNL